MNVRIQNKILTKEHIQEMQSKVQKLKQERVLGQFPQATDTSNLVTATLQGGYNSG